MALEVYLSSFKEVDNKAKCLDLSFDDNGYYWYMYPFFEEIGKSHGLMIDLYGDAKFFGGNLNILEEQIVKISESIENQPKEWKVKIGEEYPGKKELFDLVNKKQFEKLIQKILHSISIAKKEDKYLIFIGD
jgi:hypothetical protein